MHSTIQQLYSILRDPETGSVEVKGRVGSVASANPVTASVDGVTIPCRQIAGQTLTVGQPCMLLTLGVGVKPLLIQTA